MIFNKQKYHNANKLNKVQYFEFFLGNDSSPIRSSFIIKGNQAISLPNAPYCGLEIPNTITDKQLEELFQKIKLKLKTLGCNKILIKQAPPLLSNTSDRLQELLTRHAVSVKDDINHFIKLDGFENRIHSMQKRKIKKCKKESLSFNLEPKAKAPEVYSFIAKCRQQQGLSVNITATHFNHLINTLPDDYDMYTVRDHTNTILACTVTLRINKHTTYNYLPAFDRTYKSLSPLTYLQYMLSYKLIKEGFTILDLGISSINGIPQESLISFKEKMGGIRQYRYTYLIENQN